MSRKSGPISRRRLVGTTAAAAVTAPVLAACGTEGGTTAKEGPASRVVDAPTESATPEGEALVAVADVPVGGGVVVDGVVVTQPSEDSFRAFEAVCTHQRCAITQVTDRIDCTCHYSHFSLSDGSVVEGPAQFALPAVRVTVAGDTIHRV